MELPSGGTDSHENTLEQIRRLDWRFLLPDPNLRRVAYIGAVGTPLYDALKRFSTHLVRLDSEGQAESDFDLLVVDGRATADWSQAVRCLRPGGFLFVEWRRSRLLQSPGKLVALLTAYGCQNLTLHWHRPAFASSLDIVPLQQPDALRYIFSRNSSSFKAVAQKLVGLLLLRSAFLDRILPCISIVAQKPRVGTASKTAPEKQESAVASKQGGSRLHLPQKVAPNIVLRFLLEHEHNLELARFGDPRYFSTAILTPRFKASAHLVFFVLSKERQQPVLIAKLPRLSGDNKRLDREAKNLQRVQTLRKGGFDSVPRLIAYEDFCGYRLLLETAVSGQTMRPSYVRRQPELCLQKGLSWLLELQQASRARSRQKMLPVDKTLEDLMHELSVLQAACDDDGALLARTLKLARKLESYPVPPVLEHGDFSSPNILISEQQEIGVVDWELAERNGLPAVDLYFFLSYIAFSLRKAHNSQQQLHAFKEAFFGPRAWAKQYVDKYFEALALPRAAAAPLFVIGWSRYVASLLTRLHPAEQTAATGAPGATVRISSSALDWLHDNRYYQMWRYAIEHYHELNLVDERP